MLDTALTTLLVLSLSSTPFVPKGSPSKGNPPPPVEHPKPPPPPPTHDRPDHDQPHPDHSDRGPYYQQDGSQYQEAPADRVIRRHMDQVEGCMGRVHMQAPNLHGVVTLEWDVGLDGRVQQATIMDNSTGDTELGNCILQAVKSWEFRHGDATYPGHIRHSFELQTAH